MGADPTRCSFFFTLLFYIYIHRLVFVSGGKKCSSMSPRRVLLHDSQVTLEQTEAVKGGSERPDRIRDPYRWGKQKQSIDTWLIHGIHAASCLPALYTVVQLIHFFVVVFFSLPLVIYINNESRKSRSFNSNRRFSSVNSFVLYKRRPDIQSIYLGQRSRRSSLFHPKKYIASKWHAFVYTPAV